MVEVGRLDLEIPCTSWIVTDGKAGDEGQCLGVAEALGLTPELHRVRPGPPFTWAAPWGPIDPRDAPGRRGSPIAPPFPDLVLASGRRAIPYCRAVKRASGGRTFTVILKDPRTGANSADLIWVPEHDPLRGPNVVTTLTPPHRVTAERLARARATGDPRVFALKTPRVAVLVGGTSRHHRFTQADSARFLGHLTSLAETGASLMITASRRTPPDLLDGLLTLATRHAGFLWDGSGENPYAAMLALADAIVATSDSYNMVGEAAVTGAPILVFEPSGGHRKLSAFLDGMAKYGATTPFAGRLETLTYEPLNATPTIAAAIAAGLARHRRSLGLPESP